ncbi:MAG: hypothetical protein U9P68_03685 [Pseudomonadota bacterium]|nr:hypothetical protein [Pseudomonadota bacterium]
MREPTQSETREANVNVSEFIGKRVLRLGWLILLLVVAESFVSGATPQSGLSRTAPLPPLQSAAMQDERQSVH